MSYHNQRRASGPNVNKMSHLLAAEDNELVFSLLGKRCVVSMSEMVIYDNLLTA